MAELINRPEYLNQLIENKDVDLVKIVTRYSQMREILIAGFVPSIPFR